MAFILQKNVVSMISGRQVEAAVPAFGGAVVASFQMPVDLKLLVTPLGGGPCLIFFLPFP